MSRIRLLDCTLRDGGYINGWAFGRNNIRLILDSLIESGIDIIECGFISQKDVFTQDISQFNTVGELSEYLPEQRDGTMFVTMVNCGEFRPEDIEPRTERTIDGIRVAFHKKNKAEALALGRAIRAKGYELFLQPMVSLNYSDREFLDLIEETNEMKPYAFYIVDSFGSMVRRDLERYLLLADHNLSPEIVLGLHSHNNLQLSFSHAQLLCEANTKHELIIDSSIFGMGRGAGNLNTELFARFLNDTQGSSYAIAPLLRTMDKVLGPIYQNKYWGYSLPQYLSAMHNCHPNYATYLDNKNTLTFEGMEEIFRMLPAEKRMAFDKAYIEALYLQYQGERAGADKTLSVLQAIFSGKDVLVLAPGKSIYEERERVQAAMNEPGTITVAVNFVPGLFAADRIFISNSRRWDAAKDGICGQKCIVTSNIDDQGVAAHVVDYSSLLNNVDPVQDNAALLLIRLLERCGARSVRLAGLDGYSRAAENYAETDMEFVRSANVLEAKNEGMRQVLRAFAARVPISFVTKPNYVTLN